MDQSEELFPYAYGSCAVVETEAKSLSWFSLKENHSSRTLTDHSNCETALVDHLSLVQPMLPNDASWSEFSVSDV
jgi:hypothetical protein